MVDSSGGRPRLAGQQGTLYANPCFRRQPGLPLQENRRRGEGRKRTARHRGSCLAGQRGAQQPDSSREPLVGRPLSGRGGVLLLSRRARFVRGGEAAGFTLIEMIVVVFLLALAMLGI